MGRRSRAQYWRGAVRPERSDPLLQRDWIPPQPIHGTQNSSPVLHTKPNCPFQHCPQGEVHTQGKCWCDPNKSFGEPSPVLYHAAVTYGALGDRSRVVLLFEPIRCSIQVIGPEQYDCRLDEHGCDRDYSKFHFDRPVSCRIQPQNIFLLFSHIRTRQPSIATLTSPNAEF